MTILQQLTDRFRARRTDATASYWSSLAKVASDPKPSDRTLDALDKAATGADKAPADVARDLAALGELAELQDAPDALANARIAHRSALAGRRQMDDRATAMAAEAATLRETATRTVEAARNAVTLAEGRAQQFAAVRARLAAAGHPDAAEAERQREQARRIENVEAELRTADGELATAIGGRREDVARRQRDAVAERLRRLRAGEPEQVAEADDFDDADAVGAEAVTQ